MLPDFKTIDPNGVLGAFRTGETDGVKRFDRDAQFKIGQAAQTKGYLGGAQEALKFGKIDLAAQLEKLGADKQARFYDALGRAASGADTPEKWTAMVSRISAMYGPEAVKGFEHFSARPQAIAISMSALEQAKLKMQMEENARSAEEHRYKVTGLYNASVAPLDTSLYTAMGLPPPAPSPLRIIPPRPSFAGPAPTPVPSSAPLSPELRPPIAGAGPTPPAVSPSHVIPRFDERTPTPAVYPTPTGVPGVTTAAAPAPSPVAPPAPVASPAAPANPWASDPRKAAAAMLEATGRAPKGMGAAIAAGPAWYGVPEPIRVKAWEGAQTAAASSATHQGTVSTIERLMKMAPDAYVGANAEARAGAAAILSSLGVNGEWLINNRSLPATQLLQQGLSQFIGTEAEKFKPISNSDISFIARTLPNAGQDRTALLNALEAMKKVALRQALYEAGRADLLQRGPSPDLVGLAARVREMVPDHVYDPTLGGRPGGPNDAAAGGTGAAGPVAVGAIAENPTTGERVRFDGSAWVPVETSSPPARRLPSEPDVPLWRRYR